MLSLFPLCFSLLRCISSDFLNSCVVLDADVCGIFVVSGTENDPLRSMATSHSLPLFECHCGLLDWVFRQLAWLFPSRLQFHSTRPLRPGILRGANRRTQGGCGDRRVWWQTDAVFLHCFWSSIFLCFLLHNSWSLVCFCQLGHLACHYVMLLCCYGEILQQESGWVFQQPPELRRLATLGSSLATTFCGGHQVGPGTGYLKTGPNGVWLEH